MTIEILGKSDKFPSIAIMGDMKILSITQDLFVFDGKKWVLVGGEYLPKSTRERIFEYFSDGWEDPIIMQYDLLNFLDTSDFFQKVFYNRIVDLAKKIVPSE